MAVRCPRDLRRELLNEQQDAGRWDSGGGGALPLDTPRTGRRARARRREGPRSTRKTRRRWSDKPGPDSVREGRSYSAVPALPTGGQAIGQRTGYHQAEVSERRECFSARAGGSLTTPGPTQPNGGAHRILPCFSSPHRPGENKLAGASLVAQGLRICLPVQGTRVRALVREDPTCRGATKPVRHNY